MVSGLERLPAELEVAGGDGAQLELAVDMGTQAELAGGGQPSDVSITVPFSMDTNKISFEGREGGAYLIRASIGIEEVTRLYNEALGYFDANTEPHIEGVTIYASDYQNQGKDVPQIVHRFEKGSVEIHTQKIDAETLGNAFVSFLQEQSRQ